MHTLVARTAALKLACLLLLSACHDSDPPETQPALDGAVDSGNVPGKHDASLDTGTGPIPSDASVIDGLRDAAADVGDARVDGGGGGLRLTLSSLVTVTRNASNIPLRVTAEVPLVVQGDGESLTLTGDGVLNEMAQADGACVFTSTDPGLVHVDAPQHAGALTLTLTLVTPPTEHEQCPDDVFVSCTDGICHGWAAGFIAAHTNSLTSSQTSFIIEDWEHLSSHHFRKHFPDSFTLGHTTFSDVTDLELDEL